MVWGPATQLLNPEMENLLSSRFTFAWRLIEEVVLTGSAASVTFSNIPQIYRSLVMTLDLRTDASLTSDFVSWRANGDAGANYDFTIFQATGGGVLTGAASVGASNGIVGRCDAANSRTNNFSSFHIFWPDYAQTNQEKNSTVPWSYSFGATPPAAAGMLLYGNASRWRNVVAINSLFIFAGANNLVSGCRLALYGVL